MLKMFGKYRNRPRDEVAEFIESYIITNKAVPHEKLPSERNLCETYGFNRATLRSAIKKLEIEGIVYSKHGSGTFVAPPRLLRNLQDMESLALVAQRAHKTLRTTVLYQKILKSDIQTAGKMELPPDRPVFMLRRLRAMDAVPFMLETTCLDYTLCPGIEKYDFSGESLYQVLERNFKLRVDHGVEQVGITLACVEESALLEIPAGRAMFFITGVSYIASGRRVEYFESVIRSDQVRFISTLVRQ
jgi:GntR family transcriptional regulator